MNIREAYADSARYLQNETAQDSQEARATARLIVDYVTEMRYAHLLHPDLQLSSPQLERLEESLAEIAQGRPLPYLTGRSEFFGLTFGCDERALIPRPETETLVEAAIARLKNRTQPRVADLGTGTGCIAISIAYARPDATLYATDVRPDTLALAMANARVNEVTERIQFLPGRAGAWAVPMVHEMGTFDAVLSNPPYIATVEIATLQPEIRDWEPREALDGGMDGLECYRQLAAQCGCLLALNGFLMVELGAGQFTPVREIFTSWGWLVGEPLHDLAGIARVLTAWRE